MRVERGETKYFSDPKKYKQEFSARPKTKGVVVLEEMG